MISNAQLDDSAHYRCAATNYLGRASSAARVKVNLGIEEGDIDDSNVMDFLARKSFKLMQMP